MDQRTELLISLACASASNCIPCFDHYYQEAMLQNIEPEDVRKTMVIAARIKGASAIFTKKAINDTMGDTSESPDCPCGDQNSDEAPTESCC